MKIIYKGKKSEIEMEIEENVKVVDVFREEIEENSNSIVVCKCNNEIKGLDHVLKDNDKVELIDITHRDGRRVYIRGLIYIMSKALNKVYPEAYLTVNYQLSNSIFCQIDNMEITQEVIKNIDAEMRDIISKDLEIRKVEMTKQEAQEFYSKEKTLRGILQLDNKQKNEVSLYFCEDYYNYLYGAMPISTGYIKLYEIMKYSNGFLLRYPSKKNPAIIGEYVETKKLLSTLEEYDEIYKTLEIDTLYKINQAIREGKQRDIILLSEALHEKKISDIADNVVKKKGIKMVLIAGPSSSGKTTFAKRLGIQLRLNGLKPVTISVDNYFVEREDTPKDENGKYDFERIDAIDLDLFNDHLTKLLNGEEIKVPTFNFKIGSKEYNGETMKLAEDEILVIEGIHCLNDKLTSSVPKEQKYKVYISALTVLNIDYYNRISTTDTRLIRRMVRDYQFRGYSALHTLQAWASVNKGEENYIFPFQEDADSMFNTSIIYEICVLKKYAMKLLEEIDNTHEEYSEAKSLYEFLKYFEDIDDKYVPENSLLREFIGGSIFEE